MKTTFLNIAERYKNGKTLGPKIRYIIWLQGCDKRCEGCISKDWQPHNKGLKLSLEELSDDIMSENNVIEGITFSGGEPFLQAENLYLLIKDLKKKSSLGIIIYSGYKLEELKNMGDKNISGILDEIDLLIDGEYTKEFNNDKGIVGSSNQQLHFFTERYKKYKDDMLNCKREVEININKGMLIGVPPKKLLKG